MSKTGVKQVTVTEEGLKKMQEEYDYLKTIKRKEVIEAIGRARAFGDLSENSEYDEAKNEQAKVEAAIIELEEKLRIVKVVSDSEIKTDSVSVGTKVRVNNLSLNKEIMYSVVGSTEADPFNKKVSDESPLGKALIGAKKGETVQYETPKGMVKLEILEIAK